MQKGTDPTNRNCLKIHNKIKCINSKTAECTTTILQCNQGRSEKNEAG